MTRLIGLGAVLILAACGTGSTAGVASSPSPASSPSADQVIPSTPALRTPSPGSGSRSPSPPALATPTVACKTGATGGALVMMGGYYGTTHLIYDVSEATHPRLLCRITGTSAHLFTGDTFVYLKPVSQTETDVVLHSLGSGNESKAASFPYNLTDPVRNDLNDEAWTPDGSLLAFTVPDENSYTSPVWLYSQGKAKIVHTYGLPIGDCICRFGLAPQILALSPDGQYLVDGWIAGKGSTPLTVIRVADGATVLAADTRVFSALWDRTGHRLFLIGDTTYGTYSWTPEAGLAKVPGSLWQIMPGISPDGTLAAYTAYSDAATALQPRVYTFDLKAQTNHTLIDKLRTQVIFVKDGWVWYLEERACTAADSCAGSTTPTGNVFTMQLSTGVEQPVIFASGENPLTIGGWPAFTAGEYWPNS